MCRALILLKLAADRGLANLQVFGDGKIVIDCTTGKIHMENFLLFPVMEKVNRKEAISNSNV